jgi:hypothetical protein
MPVKLNIWQIMLAIGMIGLIFALWTTSDATRAMLIVLAGGGSIVAVTIDAILRLFSLLAQLAGSPCRKMMHSLLLKIVLVLIYCALAVNIILFVCFYFFDQMHRSF